MSDSTPEIQDGEESSHDSEGPSSPGEGPESPNELKSDEIGERVSSINCPESGATAVLSSRDLWQLFDAIGTEMIVTRRGRRMFPAIKVELYDLKPDVSYVLLMDMAPVDKYRYKYNAGWVRCFEEECAPTRLYIHPDSPALGTHWTSVVINFYKLKLTNNQLDKQGHIIVNSMHRYQPRLHIVESEDVNNFNWDTRQTFIFPGTQFTTVTAYQNDKITQLKIQTNPFAKGFRTPFSRCRSRNPPGTCARFTLRSGSCSDSGVEDPPHPSPSSLPHSSPTSIFSPRLLLPSHDSSQFLIHSHDSTRLLVQGQDSAPRVLLPGLGLQQLLLPPEQETQQRVLLAGQDGKPILLPGQDTKTHFLTAQDGQRIIVAGQDGQNVLVTGQNYQKLILPMAQKFSASAQPEAQVARLMLGPDSQKIVLSTQNGQKVVPTGQNFVLQHQDNQKVILAGQDGQVIVLSGQDPQQVLVLGTEEKKQVISGHNLTEIAGKKRRHTEDTYVGRKLPCLSTPQTSSEQPVVLMYRQVVTNPHPQLMSSTVLQPHSSRPANSPAYTIVAAPQDSSPQPTSHPQVSTTHPLTTTSLVFTSSSSPRILTSLPHILTSAPPTTTSPLYTQTSSTSTTPTVVNGLIHLKPTEMKPVQIIKASSEAKKPTMDISCLTKEGVARTQTQIPPPLLQIQNRKKSDQTAAESQPESSQDCGSSLQLLGLTEAQQETAGGQVTGPVEVSREPQQNSPAVRQDVVLVQASPPSGMQRVLVIGEKGEPVPQPRMVLPVAYDQQLVSMPIYRVGNSLGGLQPVQVLAPLPSSGGTTT